MRAFAILACGLLALSGHATAQVIEQRSSIRNPDGSMTHSARSSYSESTYTGESTGPDGITTGFNVRRDSAGKLHGDEWRSKDGQKLETRKITGEDSGIGGRTSLGGFGGIGSGAGNFGSFGTPGFGAGSNFGSTGFGSNLGGVGSNLGGVGAPGFSGFPSGGLPWANFGNFGNPYGGQFATPGFAQMPQFNFANFGYQQPLAVPNYSKFLLGGVGFNPNIANDAHFANVAPRIGLNSGFGGIGPGSGFGSGFGNPGFGQRSYKQEVDPASGKTSYSYSESSGHSSSSNTHQ